MLLDSRFLEDIQLSRVICISRDSASRAKPNVSPMYCHPGKRLKKKEIGKREKETEKGGEERRRKERDFLFDVF